MLSLNFSSGFVTSRVGKVTETFWVSVFSSVKCILGQDQQGPFQLKRKNLISLINRKTYMVVKPTISEKLKKVFVSFINPDFDCKKHGTV